MSECAAAGVARLTQLILQYLESDADEQLILQVPFTGSIKCELNARSPTSPAAKALLTL